MPNWCSNVLLAVGEPEAVAEFRILNAQHTQTDDSPDPPVARLSNPFALPGENPNPLEKMHECLVGRRHANDVSFSALADRSGWGTKWDVSNAVYNQKPDRGAWRLPGQDLVLGRLEQWGMGTAWGPPDLWLDCVGKIFPTISLVLGYEESGNGVFGVCTADGHNFSHEQLKPTPRSEPKAMTIAISRAKKLMPLHRKPNALLRAIWEDNAPVVRQALSRSSPAKIDIDVQSRWSALMHAAFAGSEKVARILLDAGADPLQRVKLGQIHSFGFNDICLDVNTEQTPALVRARQSIFLSAIQKCSGVAEQLLGTGRNALTMALRYQMGPLISALAAQCPLVTKDINGNSNGSVEALVNGFSGDSLQALINCIEPNRVPNFTNQIITSLIESYTPGLRNETNDSKGAPAAASLLLYLHDSGLMSPAQFKMLCREAPVKVNEDKSVLMIGDALGAVVACERARRAIDEIMAPARMLRMG